MAVLNVTPDSFSDGGLFENPDRALEQALRLEREGAHILDVGGESTRPGARPVSAKEEIQRIRPVLKRLAKKLKFQYPLTQLSPKWLTRRWMKVRR